MRVSNIEYFYVLITASPLSRVMQNILDKSSAVAEMAAKCCTIRTVKRWGGSVFVLPKRFKIWKYGLHRRTIEQCLVFDANFRNPEFKSTL